MWTNNVRNKYCATCANWGGRREARNNLSIVDQPSDRGPCYGGVPADSSRGPCACKPNCPKWQPWGAINR